MGSQAKAREPELDLGLSGIFFFIAHCTAPSIAATGE
jgi:hypothetical protein